MPIEGKVKIYVGDKIKNNSRVYVYRNNNETGKLDTIRGGKQKIDKDGYIELDILDCKDYVILPKKADISVKTTLLNQVEVQKKCSIKIGNKKNISIDIPDTLELVKELGKGTYSSRGDVKIEYSSSNKKVATVNSNGKITAKKAGKITINVKVTLYSGKTKTYKTIVTIK